MLELSYPTRATAVTSASPVYIKLPSHLLISNIKQLTQINPTQTNHMNRLSLVTRHLSQILIPKSKYTPHTTPRAISTTTSRTMPQYTGSCYCRNIKYEISLSSPDEARTSLCHCSNCKKAFGTNYGLTAKIPKDAFRLTAGKPKEHVGDNGSGSLLHREFCDNCGSFILEYGDAVKDQARYICVGTLDDPEALPPKGEFFCSSRASWMPEIPNVFHKQKIKE